MASVSSVFRLSISRNLEADSLLFSSVSNIGRGSFTSSFRRCKPFKGQGKGKSTVRCSHSLPRLTFPSHGYDYYELLCVDPNSSFSEIKASYRWLQKRCHPDVAGDLGHEMSLLLNESYAVLSSDRSRAAYDQIRAEKIQDDKFSGLPIWSTWFGHPDEDKAVFVDETQCIGCLKCAEVAPDTFAIERRCGKARALWQWGDVEADLQAAVDCCPVNCIRWVDKEKLPALEFIMSEMNPAVGTASVKGNVFAEADRFLAKRSKSEQSVIRTYERSPAAETIRAKSGQWWQFSIRGMGDMAGLLTIQKSQGAMVHVSHSFSYRSEANIPIELQFLMEAARHRSKNGHAASNDYQKRSFRYNQEDYWRPSPRFSCAIHSNGVKPKQDPIDSDRVGLHRSPGVDSVQKVPGFSFFYALPVMTAVSAMIVVSLTGGGQPAQSATDIVGPIPAEIVVGFGSQIALAGFVWYIIGSILSGFAAFVSLLLVQSSSDSAE